MRKVILDLAVSLDGFIEGPQGEVDWCIMDEDMGFDEFLAGIDTIFYGRVSYDAWGNFVPNADAAAAEQSFWSAIHTRKKYVFTRKPGQDDSVTYVAGDIAQQVAEIKRQEGGAIWLYGGAKLISTFANLKLIDVYRISVHPVVLGGGKPLFENLQDRIDLRLAAVNRFRSGVVQLVYEYNMIAQSRL